MTKKLLAGAVAAAVVGMAPMTASAVNFKDVMSGDVDFSIGGYVKLNALWTEYDQGDISGNSLTTEMYFPGGVPVGASGANGDSGENSHDLDMSARESRINFKAATKIDGHDVASYLEIDFMPHFENDGNELISNSWTPRLRHAFLKFDNWLFGQTWSTYMDTGALPESVDFLAASESTVFVRQPQIRYTNGPLQLALENPESWNDGGADRDDNDLPDMVANYTVKGDWGHVRLNGVLRDITEVDAAANTDDSALGWGLGLTGKYMVGKDDLKFSLNYGEGLGRYIGLALPRDGSIDSSGDIDLSETTAFFVAYRHWWTDKTRSSIIYSFADWDYDSNPAAPITATNQSESIAVNLIYSPVKPVSLGVMYLHGEVETEDDREGEIDRIQFSAKYAF